MRIRCSPLWAVKKPPQNIYSTIIDSVNTLKKIRIISFVLLLEYSNLAVDSSATHIRPTGTFDFVLS